MRYIYLALCTCLIALLAPNGLAQCQGFAVVSQDAVQVSLVLPEQPSFAEKLAADVLRKYISRATGMELAITQEPVPPDVPGIFIGNTVKSGIVHPQLDQLTLADGFVIQVDPAAVIIRGKANSGVVFAAYHFLEKFIGCRWYGPGELWEIVPKTTTLVIPEALVVEEPDFQLRIMNNIIDILPRLKS
jgi:hypothetical protein